MTLSNLVNFAVLVSVTAATGCGRKMKAQKQEGVSRFEVMTCETLQQRKFTDGGQIKNTLTEQVVVIGRRVMMSPDGLAENSTSTAQGSEKISKFDGDKAGELLGNKKYSYSIHKTAKRQNLGNGQIRETGTTRAVYADRVEQGNYSRLLKTEGAKTTIRALKAADSLEVAGNEVTESKMENGVKVEVTKLEQPTVITEGGVEVTIVKSETTCRTTVQ